MGEPFVGVAFASNSSFVTIYNNQDIEIVSIENCISPLPSLTWEYVFGLTNLIGLTYDDQKIQQFVKENIIEIVDREGTPEIKKMDLEEISSLILKEIKRIADSHLDLRVTMVVLSVPDNFNRQQKEQVTCAAKLAGFNNIDIITESAAAALQLNSNIKNTVALYRFAKGNFTMFIMSLVQQAPVVKIIYENICINDDIYIDMWKIALVKLNRNFTQFIQAPNDECVIQKQVLEALKNNDKYREFHLHGTSFTINWNNLNITLDQNLYMDAVLQVVGRKISDIIKRSIGLAEPDVKEIIHLGTPFYNFQNLNKVSPNFSYKNDYSAIIRGLALHGWKLLTLKVADPTKELKIEEPKEDELVHNDKYTGLLEKLCQYKKSVNEMRKEIEKLTSTLTEATEQNKQLSNEIEIHKKKHVDQSKVNTSLMKNVLEFEQEIEELRKMVKQNE